ncbi:carboxylesterase family protein [Streptomyces fructofermentans]|uniref:carboxylesterase/lipase family protein n=1 Tax=Streptomyces fructofermentans TaxID=152141 RepID=UPI0033EB6EB6
MSAEEPEVRTKAGAVRGAAAGGAAVFRGVPFAEPPVGALRFAAPRPARSWDGVRPALEFGPPPPQSSAFGMDALSAGDTSGDWLTLNVWTPDPGPGAGLPVMVWLHGGAYTIGTSGLPEYDGGRLAREGVVVVTLNQRLGVEGFALIEGAPANRGLLDQVAALEWVRDNIRSFGGDPGRVTLFGESAGAGCVAALLAMPRARGLFRRAVAQSVPAPFLSAELAAEVAVEFGAELALRPTADDLATVAPARLPSAADSVGARLGGYADRWGVLAHTSVAISPVVDGEVLPVAPWEALSSGAARDVDLLVGHTRDEYRLFMAFAGTLGAVTPEQADEAVRVFAPGSYREAFPDAGPEEVYGLVRSDWLFRMPSLHLAEAQLSGGGRAHFYELTWPAPAMGGALGACHGLDVPLVFGNLRGGLPSILLGEEPPAEAEALSESFRAAWTGFAAGRGPGWGAYEAGRREVRLFDVVPEVVPYPEEASRRLWEGHVFGALPLEA